jgi:hypothetical protein
MTAPLFMRGAVGRSEGYQKGQCPPATIGLTAPIAVLYGAVGQVGQVRFLRTLLSLVTAPRSCSAQWAQWSRHA